MEQAVLPMWVGGEPVIGQGEEIESINPANGNLNHRVSAASSADVSRAVAVAREAYRTSGWAERLPHERAKVLHAIAALIEEHAEELAKAQMVENGKVIRECRAQARSAAATFRYYAAVCESLCDEVTPSRGNYLSFTQHEPHGVVAAITPWNSPLTMEAQKVAPALAAGNAIVLKPSEITSLPALKLAQLAERAGLPKGVLNVIPGHGYEAGKALVDHADVNMITFTGGTESGRHIAEAAAKRFVPVALELGGKSPHMVFADADLGRAAKEVIGGIFEAGGQSCVAGSRVFVQSTIYEQFLSMLREQAEGLRVGDPTSDASQMGPISSFQHRDRIEAIVNQAVTKGAQVLTGGKRLVDEGRQHGAYYAPTLIVGVNNEDEICQTEIFGPVACVMPFEDEDDLVEQANNTVFGLAAGVWTQDVSRAVRVARGIQAGSVWINTYKQLSIATPFGGYKESGLGREKGIQGLRLYQQVKSVYLGLEKE